MATPQRFTQTQDNPDDIFGGSVLPQIPMPFSGGTGTGTGTTDPTQPNPAMLATGGFDFNTGAMTTADTGAAQPPVPPVPPTQSTVPAAPAPQPFAQPFAPPAQPAASTKNTAHTQSGAEMPTGPVLSDTDPRLTDPQHGNDPEVLYWINHGIGSTTVNGAVPGGLSGPDTIQWILSHGYAPQQAIDYVHANNLPGGEAAYYPANNTIGMTGGYLLKDADGTWHWHVRTPENPAAPTTPGTPAPFNPGSLSPSDFPPITPMTGVGQDPFSQLITGGLGTLINDNGMTPEQQSLFATLSDIIGRSGKLPADDAIVQQQLESARESESHANTSMLNDARAELANRGLVGEPGVPQGEEGGAISRITQAIAPTYAGAVRDINTASIQRQNDRLTNSLSTMLGLTSTAASNLLGALGQGTDRQLGLARIALDTLSQNIQWNEFLANYGLTRDQVLYQIQAGNANALLPLLTLFTQLTSIGAAGTPKV